jgi:serralysin
MHELGHAIGLDHMGNYNGSATSPSSYQDSTVFSIMSYFGPSWGSGTAAGAGRVAWADWVGADGRLYAPQTPMLNDIMAIQYMYGVETTTRIEDTVYGFNSTVTGPQKVIFDFSLNRNPIITVFDAGGIDTLDLGGFHTSSIIDLAPGAFSSCNSMTSNIAIAYTSNIENAVSGGGADKISGNTLANVLSAGAGNDALYGLAGNDVLNGEDGDDTLDGGTGADTMSGAAGNDVYVVDSTGDIVNESEAGGYDTVRTTLTSYVLAGILEALEFAGTGSCKGTGNALANKLSGGTGNDFLYGLAGDDILNGNSGADTLDGGAGSDTMSGGAGNDIYLVDDLADLVNEATSAGLDTIKTTLSSYVLGDNVETLEFTGTGTTSFTGTGNALANTLHGGAGNDSLYGLAGNDVLNGQGGDDVLDGGAGGDTMNGGAGADVYLVDNTADRVNEAAGAGTDTVKTTLAAYVLTENVEVLEFVGADTSSFKGTGNALANVISGGGANDMLNGGLGADQLWGKGGADYFDMTTLLGGGNVDVIKDFNVADDTIRLENAVFRAFGTYIGAMAESAFWTGTAAHDADDRIVFNSATGALSYDSDGSGVAQAVQFATLDLSGLRGTLMHTDFLVI